MDLPRIDDNLSDVVKSTEYNKTCLEINESMEMIQQFFVANNKGRFIVFGSFVYLGFLRHKLEEKLFTVDHHVWFKTDRYSSTLKEFSTLFTHEVIFFFMYINIHRIF